MDPIDRRMILGAAGLAGVAAMTKLAGAGPLNPPAGPVGPTGQTLDDIYNRIARTDVGVAEPRIPVQSLPGSATALHVISEPGSYYLTGNIEGVAGKNGIEITTDDVSVDMRGFRMRGVVGASAAVYGKEVSGVRLTSGTISDWSGGGAIVGPNAIFKDMSFELCGNPSLYQPNQVGPRSMVMSCRFSENVAVNALGVASGSLVDSCVFVNNSQTGVQAQCCCVISRCVAVANGAGIKSSFASLIMDCQALGNGAIGIFAEFDCRVSGCQTRENGAGIVVAAGTCISDCFASADGTGFQGGDVHLERSVAFNCGVGYFVAGRSAVLACRARACPVPYSLAATVSHGPLIDVTGGGDISTVPGAIHPWANFIY